jgi:hypothetical protein
MGPVSGSVYRYEDDPVAVAEPRFRWEWWIGVAVVLLCSGYVFWQLTPGISFWPIWRIRFGVLFADTTTNGGDMGAHVWWPAFLREHWFTHGRLSGWAPDWYAGFPVGQFYFPLPAVLVSALDLFIPYNVAFKFVTVSGAVLLPYAAWEFARGLRFPWPAPPLFSIAVVRYMFEVRHIGNENTWTIYGGNLAGLLAGEFAFALALALALLFLGTLGRTLDTGKRPWLPAMLLALTVTCHIIVAVFAVVGAIGVLLARRPLRTAPIAVAVGVTAFLLTAVWVVPLLATQAYTTNMRYERVTRYTDFLFRLPRGLWLLIFVAVVCTGWWRRTTTLLLIGMAAAFAVLFRFWGELHVWNTRFLPFYWLTVALLGAAGAVEVVRFVGNGAVWIVDWVRAGDVPHRPERAAGADRAVPVDDAVEADEAEVFDDDAEVVDEAFAAPMLFDGPVAPDGAPDEPAEVDRWHSDAPLTEHRRSMLLAVVSSILVVGVVLGLLSWVNGHRAPVPGWASWNYSGYERKAAYPEFRDIIDTMDRLGRKQPGRALWEPSSTLNTYGTTLALELLPYFTKGRISSMEGLYFESAATTPYHFLTVSELAAPGNPSNPVRGLDYGTIDDFDLGVRHLQMLGVRYYMAQSSDAKRRADGDPHLRLVAEVPDRDQAEPLGWKIYEVSGSALVEGLRYEPVVVTGLRGRSQSECFGSAPNPGRDPDLSAWECAAAPWWRDRAALDVPFAASGPPSWARVDATRVDAAPRKPLPPVRVSDIVETPHDVSFHVDQIGRPVVVKVSYFPNWQVHGAKGPYRLAPNLMVVIPTAHDVRLTYGLTKFDWLGRLLTLVGLAALWSLLRADPARIPSALGRGRNEGPLEVEAAVVGPAAPLALPGAEPDEPDPLPPVSDPALP